MNNLRKTTALLLTILILVVSQALLSQDLEFDVQEHILDNGLKILVLERHHSPTFSVYIYYPVGSVNEVTNHTGVSHFIEHMMFKGTKTLCTTNFEAEVSLMKAKDELYKQISEEYKKPNPDETKLRELTTKVQELETKHREYIVSNETDKIYAAAGGTNMNAGTSNDYTCYYLSLPKNKLELWCAIESDIMSGPVFREFYAERAVITEERRMTVEDEPGGVLYEQLIAAAYTTHPYGISVIGSMADIQNYTREYVEEYRRKYYAPNRAIITIVGDVDSEMIFEMIDRYFGDIPRQPDPPNVTAEEPPQRGERRVEVEFDASPQIGIAFHKTDMTHPDQAVFDVLSEILSSGRTSRLYRKLVEEEQIAVSVYSGTPDSKYPGLYYIFAVPRAPHTVAEVEKSIYDEIEKFKVEEVTDWELQRAKNRLTAGFIMDLKSNDGLASSLGYHEALDSWEFMAGLLDRWNAVTAEDIQRVVKEYLVKSNRTVAWISRVQQ